MPREIEKVHLGQATDSCRFIELPERGLHGILGYVATKNTDNSTLSLSVAEIEVIVEKGLTATNAGLILKNQEKSRNYVLQALNLIDRCDHQREVTQPVSIDQKVLLERGQAPFRWMHAWAGSTHEAVVRIIEIDEMEYVISLSQDHARQKDGRSIVVSQKAFSTVTHGVELEETLAKRDIRQFLSLLCAVATFDLRSLVLVDLPRHMAQNR